MEQGAWNIVAAMVPAQCTANVVASGFLDSSAGLPIQQETFLTFVLLLRLDFK